MPENKSRGEDFFKALENLSGHPMDEVKVHFNSDTPAQLQAHAYSQGKNIHLAPGQEKHLPHEAWHIVQQKQGRVTPTVQIKGTTINDDKSLEEAADLLGMKAIISGNGKEVTSKGRNLARNLKKVKTKRVQANPARDFK